ncbi:MAG: hypothetical protein ABWY39_03440 [Mycobacterium sp.]
MVRRVAVFPAVLALAVTGVVAAGVATAEPPCSYTLSPPQVVQVSGASMVTATVSPAGCTAPSNSHLSVACLQVQGSDGPGECANGLGLVTAQVYAPYRTGATYISTGKGCASTGNPPRSFCQVVGPTAATL